eukprot:TRINITY_DN5994_c0_g1_i1.p1 TRINITY_DN5994_c0_g1~~TRINITY_DN5994_c0_g1_i1.p1  ORF type:complete len:628 (+),score=99.85 TRINITY_DN5994_c0_g1_i1:176-2059(+)
MYSHPTPHPTEILRSHGKASVWQLDQCIRTVEALRPDLLSSSQGNPSPLVLARHHLLLAQNDFDGYGRPQQRRAVPRTSPQTPFQGDRMDMSVEYTSGQTSDPYNFFGQQQRPGTTHLSGRAPHPHHGGHNNTQQSSGYFTFPHTLPSYQNMDDSTGMRDSRMNISTPSLSPRSPPTLRMGGSVMEGMQLQQKKKKKRGRPPNLNKSDYVTQTFEVQPFDPREQQRALTQASNTPTSPSTTTKNNSKKGKRKSKKGKSNSEMSMSASTSSRIPTMFRDERYEGVGSMLYQFRVNDKPKTTRKSRPPKPFKLNDFELFNTIGIGSYGVVRLCRHKTTNQTFCVKILNKQLLVRSAQTEHVRNEKLVLEAINNQGIVQLYGTFNDRDSVYLLLEFVPGGEIFYYIRKFGRLSTAVSIFYASETFLTLKYLHSHNIVFRDLKPENILLDSQGHSKLTDFGFAKVVPDKTWTTCGTPDYLAPEIIACTGHGVAVDWWSYGILLFEMMAGFPPFTDPDNFMNMFAKIREPQKIVYPPFFPSEAVNFFQRILVVDPNKRMGCMSGGPDEISRHPLFSGVDFGVISRRDRPGPITPLPSASVDVSKQAKEQEKSRNMHPQVTIPPDVQRFLDTF